MKSINRGELTSHRMAAGNEAKYSKVVLDGVLKEWVGIGWIDLRDATKNDMKKYPAVEDD